MVDNIVLRLLSANAAALDLRSLKRAFDVGHDLLSASAFLGSQEWARRARFC